MARRKHTPEQVIKKLREAEVAMAEGSTVAQASRKIGVTEQTFYRWRAGVRGGCGSTRRDGSSSWRRRTAVCGKEATRRLRPR